jgi:hypothetical protein
VEKALTPGINGVTAEHFEHAGMTPPALGQRHGQCGVKPRCNGIGVVGIDAHRITKLSGGPGELG